MKTFLPVLLIVISLGLNAQVTYTPSCISNARTLTIKKITVSDYYTIVDFEMYTTQSDYSFYFHRNMYIQKYNDPYSKKYYVRSFKGHELHQSYSVETYTTYNLQLKFDKIPEGITKISIYEPKTEGATAWYWKGITINNPSYSSSEYVLSNFFEYAGFEILAGLAHPTNEYKSGKIDIYSNSVVITINYYDGYYTKLRLNKNFGLFTGIEVLADNDWVYPFLAVSIMKELGDELLKSLEDDDETKSKLERELGKRYYEFDGIDMSLFILNVAWADY